MIHRRCAPALFALVVLVGYAWPALAQAPFQMRIQLGPNRELEVDAVYHDPADIDRRLSGTRVIPMLVSVRNASQRQVPLDYRDMTLDLGGGTGLLRLTPVDPATARTTLLNDGRYNDFLRFLASQGDRFTTIDPFSQVFPNGTLAPGRTKRGFVFFLRPANVPFNSFLALGTTAYRPEILKTNDFDVMSPEQDASSLWPATIKTWPNRFRESTKEFRQAVSNVIQEVANGAPPYKKSYALLMGVWDYKNMEALPRVRNDLDKMMALLRGLGFTIVRVENEKLTMANVKSPQEFFANVANITPEDRLLVFFAGHGFQRQERGRVRGYLALMQAKLGQPTARDTIAMDDFVIWTQRVQAKHLLVLLESCFSGLAIRGRPLDSVQLMGPGDKPPAPDPRLLYQLSKDPGRYLMMAGDENQRVPMADRWGGGLFAHAVVEGLKGSADGDRDGFVTARELYPWLRRYVETEALKVLGSSVTPLIKDLDPVVSKGEFVFTTTK
jgi:hypothetical protein